MQHILNGTNSNFLNLSESDANQHYLLHQDEQQLIFLQKPPPPSPLHEEESKEETKACGAANSSQSNLHQLFLQRL